MPFSRSAYPVPYYWKKMLLIGSSYWRKRQLIKPSYPRGGLNRAIQGSSRDGGTKNTTSIKCPIQCHYIRGSNSYISIHIKRSENNTLKETYSLESDISIGGEYWRGIIYVKTTRKRPIREGKRIWSSRASQRKERDGGTRPPPSMKGTDKSPIIGSGYWEKKQQPTTDRHENDANRHNP